jgi:PKD repeat protein
MVQRRHVADLSTDRTQISARPLPARSALTLLALTASLALALLGGAPPAQALVVKIGGRSVGVAPLYAANGRPAGAFNPAARPEAPSGPTGFDASGPLLKHSGPVMHSVTTHVIYWDPSKDFTEKTQEVINGFFTSVAHDSGAPSNVWAVAGQYTDSTGNAAYISAFAGAPVDSAAYPASGCAVPAGYSVCLTDEQLQTHLSAYILANKLPRGMTQQYFVLFPHKVVTCLTAGVCSNNSFCAYHSFIAGASKVIYSDIPFSLMDKENAKSCQADGYAKIQQPNADTTGFADVALKYTSHEYNEASTDPLLNAWYDKEGAENGDKCNFYAAKAGKESDPNAFRPTLGGAPSAGTLFNQLINGTHYYIQSEWDNAVSACRMEPLPLSGSVNASPQSGIAGAPVSFSASVTDPYGEPTYSWTFGDGGQATGPSVSHAYASPGTYTVTMTAVDPSTGATSGAVERAVTVTLTGEGGGTGGGTPGSGSGAASTPPAGQATPGTSSPTTNPAPPASDLAAVAASLNLATGEITFSQSVSRAGTLSWLLTFQNGRFGVFAASVSKCRPGFVRLNRKCRPARIVFARGKRAVTGPGIVTFTARPSASGLKALRNAFKRHKGVPVTATLRFQASVGGAPVLRIQALTVRLKKR